jgi:hypothetical protein
VTRVIFSYSNKTPSPGRVGSAYFERSLDLARIEKQQLERQMVRNELSREMG